MLFQTHDVKQNKAAHPDQGAPFRHARNGDSAADQAGNILIYIFIAIGLLATLTLAVTRDTSTHDLKRQARENTALLIQQADYIRAAFQECALLYPDGGGDLDGDGDIDNNDNPYTPYPLNAGDPKQPNGAGASQYLIDQQCTGAPAATAYMFQPPNQFRVPQPKVTTRWYYSADANGLRVSVSYNFPNAVGDTMVNMLAQRLPDCEFDTHDFSSTRFLNFWIRKEGCI